MNTDVGSWIWTEMLARTTACVLWGAEKHAARRMKHRDGGEIHRCSSQSLILREDIIYDKSSDCEDSQVRVNMLRKSFLIYAVTTDKVKTFIQNP